MSISPISKLCETPTWRFPMVKTMALFFVLGLMVSCASYHNERSISSVEKHEEATQRYEPKGFR